MQAIEAANADKGRLIFRYKEKSRMIKTELYKMASMRSKGRRAAIKSVGVCLASSQLEMAIRNRSDIRPLPKPEARM